MSESVFNTVKTMLVEQLGIKPENISPSTSFKGDLKTDSLDPVELVMNVEKKFKIKVEEED